MLKCCLDSILNQEIELQQRGFEIIVSVDKCDARTEKWLRQKTYSERVRVISARDGSPGANATRNAGIKIAKGEILFFLDDDCALPDKYWLMRAYKAFQLHIEAMALGGGYILTKKYNIFVICRNELDNFYLRQNMIGDNRTAALVGGASGYRKEVFLKYGYFDDRLSYGSSETELNDRIIKHGGKLYFISELSVSHMPQDKTALSYLQGSFLQGAGQAYSLIKNSIVKNSTGQEKTWGLQIIRQLDVGISLRIVALVFLTSIAFFYWLGIIAGLFWFGLKNILDIHLRTRERVSGRILAAIFKR
jgi:glycosyltransferase involved in cell wall biosynthesis